MRWTVSLPGGRTITRLAKVARNLAYLPRFAVAMGPDPGTQTWYRADGRVFGQNDAALRAAVRATDRYGIAPRALIRDFAVFNRSSQSAPRSGRLTVSRGYPGYLGPAWVRWDTGAWRTVASATGVRLWIAPDSLGACIQRHSGIPGGTITPVTDCTPSLAPVLAHGIWQQVSFPKAARGGYVMRNEIYGIVPDTNTSVTLHLSNHGTRIVPVIDGVVVTPQAGITSITVRGVDGRARTIRAPA